MRIALYWKKLRVPARSLWKKRSKEWMALSKMIQELVCSGSHMCYIICRKKKKILK